MAGQLVASSFSWYHRGQFAHLSTGPQVPGLSPPHLLVVAAQRCPLPLTWGPGLFSGFQLGLLTSPPSFWLLCTSPVSIHPEALTPAHLGRRVTDCKEQAGFQPRPEDGWAHLPEKGPARGPTCQDSSLAKV